MCNTEYSIPIIMVGTEAHGHCEHKYPEGIMGSNATDCDEAVRGGVSHSTDH